MDADAVNLAMLIARVGCGVTLALHGYMKFKSGLSGLASWFDSMGLKPGPLHAKMAAFTEVGGGLALAVGLATPFTALAIVSTMAVAGWTVHRKKFFILDEGWEYVFILALIAIVVATAGPGEWSIDNALGLDLNGVPGLAISAGGGIVAAAAFLAAFFRPPAQ